MLGTNGQILSNRKVKREKLLDAVRQLPEQTALIPAQHVKPFVEQQKNDANDARAICEAYTRSDIHFVPVKSVEQQDLKAIRSVRKRLVENRTAVANQIRGLATEYGVVFPVSIKALRSHLPLALEDAENDLFPVMRSLL